MRKRIYRHLFSFLTLSGICAAVAGLPRAAFAADPSLVGWWQFDETSGTTVSDSSGYGNTGTLTGTFTRVPGQMGNAINFGGTSYVANGPTASAFPTGNNPRTMAAWIKLPAKVTGNAAILEHDGFYMFVTSGGTLQVIASQMGESNGITGITRVDDGAWHHVASVYPGPGSNWSVYVDGKLDQVGTHADPNTGNAGTWRIGLLLNGAWNFPGIIDEVRYYGRALSTSEIQAIVAGFAVTLSQNSVASGGSVTGTVQISPAAPSGGAIVSLSSSSSAVSIPATVTVPAGATSATFTISAGTVGSLQMVTITATYGGNSAQATLGVTPPGQDPSLVGWWRFDELTGTTVSDSSGYGNTGTLNGTYTRVPGQVGGAVSFGGKSYVTNNQPAPTAFPIGTAPRTMTAWIKIPARVTDWASILDHDDFWLRVNASGVLQYNIIGISRVDDGAWHHVATVYEGPDGNYRLYVDGQLDQVGAASGPNTASGANWRIGQNLDGSSSFPGIIDEVRYYNRALSTSEIQAIVAGDGGKLGPVPVGVSQMSNVTTCVSNPGVTKMNYGDLSNCAVSAAGEAHGFQFQGNAGDEIWFNVQGPGGGSQQCFVLTDPDGIQGSQTCSAQYCCWGYNANLVQEQFLTKTGAYLIQVSGSGSSTFPFSLALKRETPLPQQIPQLAYGVAAQTMLMTPFDWHYYSAGGTAGDTLSVNLNRTQGSVDHCLRVYAPDGEVAFDGCASQYCCWGWNGTVSAKLPLTQSGGYVFRVSGDYSTGFDYSLAVNCAGTCSNAAVPPPPQVCNYSLSPPSELLSAAAAGGVLGITAPMGCPWTVSSSASFLTITTSPSGGGPDTIGFVVGPNTAAASQTSVISVAGQTSTITQLGTAPLLQATPNPLVFNVQAGSLTKSNILLSVFTNLASLAYTASTTMNLVPTLNWLTISSVSGSAPTTLAVTVDPSALPPGTFTGSVTIKSPTASPNQIVISVTVNIQSAGAAVLSVSATPITFSLATGGSGSLVQRTVSNTGAGFLAYTATVDPANPASWLTVTPSGGSVSVSTPDTLSISASPGSLAAGTYGSDILVSGNGQVVRIPVIMTVGPAGAQILVSQVGLGFTGVAGGGSPSPQTFGILNSGVGSLHWTATATTLSGGNWLQLTPSSGTVNQPLLDVSILTVSVNTSILGPGDYYGKIVITGDALNTGQIVTVLCSVLPSGSDPGPEVRPTGLIFVGTPGQKPPSQPVGVTNRIGQPVSFTSTPLTFDGASWLSQSPVTATVTPNVPGTLSVQSDDTKQVAGILRGVVTLLFQDGRSSTVNVLNVVAPTGSSSGASGSAEADALGWVPDAAGCSSPNLQVQFISLQSGFQVALGKPATVSVKAVDNCGNALVPASGTATPVTASFSNGDPDLQLVSEGGGQWSGTWIPSQMPGSGSAVTVTIHASYFSLGSQLTLQTGTASVMGSLLSSVSPLVAPGALVDAASYLISAPVAPGELISIFGSNFAVQPSSAPGTPLPSSLAGTSVLLGGVPLPLLYSSAGQINAQVPFELSVNTQHQVLVSNGGSLSVPAQITVAAAQPGIFAVNQQGTGQGIILNADQTHLTQAGTPAKRGDIVVMYCSGLGQVTPAVADGAPAPIPAATTVNPVTVQIGGANAQVQFSGLTPGFAGLYQINAVVPQGSATGNAVPVTVTVAGQTSNVVTMAIQ